MHGTAALHCGVRSTRLTDDDVHSQAGGLQGACAGCRDYVAATAELQKVDLSVLDEAQRKALFINLCERLAPAQAQHLVPCTALRCTVGG